MGLNLSDKRRLIDHHHPKLSITDQCEALEVSRSTFYYEPAQETELNLLIMRKIDELHLKVPYYGYRRITVELNRIGFCVNEKRVRRLLSKLWVALYSEEEAD